jgi:O-succinylbenzoic acid--CoA ligase
VAILEGILEGLYLNPRLPDSEQSNLTALYRELQFKGHLFLATSGTERLKLVVLKKEALLCSAESVNAHINAAKNDRWLNPLPLFHVGGLSIHARADLSQSTVITLSKWSVKAFMDAIITHHITLTSLVPTQLFDLVVQGRVCPPSLRQVFIGGSALSDTIKSKAIQLGWPILPCYGMTETASQIMVNGTIYPHVEIKQDSLGRLMVKSECLFTGYCEWVDGQPQLIDPKVEGWFLTDDYCEISSEGEVTVLGRCSEMVKVGGELVNMQRVNLLLEASKLQIQFSGSAMLVAKPDERLGHVIVLKTEFGDSEALVEDYHCRCLPFERIDSII